jgi:O-acetyl-ADP-ribose deacetylase (regulator of RNase III)
MVNLKTIKGDLIELADSGQFDVIVHGCNCFNTMGSGIAKAIRLKWPQVYAADAETVKGYEGKLGNYTKADLITTANTPLTVINAYTQYSCYYKPGVVNLDYGALERVFDRLSNELDTAHRIGIPLIGCGLAKGDWTIVEKLIVGKMSNHDITVVVW